MWNWLVMSQSPQTSSAVRTSSSDASADSRPVTWRMSAISLSGPGGGGGGDRKSTRLNSSHANISYAVFCLKKKKKAKRLQPAHRRLHVHGRGPWTEHELVGK